MRKGEILICEQTVNNLLGQPLFEKGKEYEVIYVDNEQREIMVTLNHNLYANEYQSYPIEWVNKNFKNVNG